MAIVICNRFCLVFIFRSSDLIQYGGIVTKANTKFIISLKKYSYKDRLTQLNLPTLKYTCNGT